MDFDLKNKTKLTIGRLARESGLSITTIRYYQQRGLLRQPERPPTGSFRSYGDSDLERLRLIKHAQDLGFTLAEIGELIALAGDGKCCEIKSLADQKMQRLEAEIKLLKGKYRTLESLVAQCCSACGGRCLLIERLLAPTPAPAKLPLRKRRT